MSNGRWTRLSTALTAMVLAACQALSATAQDLQDWDVDSSVSAVRLVRVEQAPDGRGVSFILKNISPKPVSALVLITPDGGVHLTDWFAREPLAPGATDSTSVAVRHGQAHILRIPALVFADGASEGDRSQIEFIKARRLGTVLETRRIIRVLESFGTGDVLKTTGVASVIQAVGMPSRSPEEAVESMRPFAGDLAAALDMAARDERARFVLFGVNGTRNDARRRLAEIVELNKSSAFESDKLAARHAGNPTSLPEFATRVRMLLAQQKAELEAMK